MISPYERYPEKSIPAIAMIKMTLSAMIFFIVEKKNKKIALVYIMKEKKQTQRETRQSCIT